MENKIYYMLPNNKQVELLSEMHIVNYDFNDFDESIEELRKAYFEVTDETGAKFIAEKIENQCFAFADFLGTQYGEIQSMININDLSIEIKQALVSR